MSGSLYGIRAGATWILRNNLVCKHVNDYNTWNTSYSLKLSYIIFILEWFPVEWRNQFLKMYNIDQEFLFPKVSKLWKSALTKKACSKWFLIYTHKFLDILQQINLSLMYSLCFSTQHPNSDYRVFFNVFCGLSR